MRGGGKEVGKREGEMRRGGKEVGKRDIRECSKVNYRCL